MPIPEGGEGVEEPDTPNGPAIKRSGIGAPGVKAHAENAGCSSSMAWTRRRPSGPPRSYAADCRLRHQLSWKQLRHKGRVQGQEPTLGSRNMALQSDLERLQSAVVGPCR